MGPPRAATPAGQCAAHTSRPGAGPGKIRTVDLTMIGLPPGRPWPAIEATLRAAAPTE